MKKIFSIFTITSVIFGASLSYSLPVLAVSLETTDKSIDFLADESKTKSKENNLSNKDNERPNSSNSKKFPYSQDQRLQLNSISFKMSVDQREWKPINGTLNRGFAINIPIEGVHYAYRYLEVADSSVNIDMLPGDYPFALVSAPEAFYRFYEHSTQEMYDIIHNYAPMFYLQADARNKFSLINGTDDARYWKVISDWPAGTYRFSGRLKAENGTDTEEVILSFVITHNAEEQAENHVPETVTEEYFVESGQPLLINASAGVLANDIDTDGPRALTARYVNFDSVDLLHGKFNLRSDGSFSYQSNRSYVGAAYFRYQAYDGRDYSPITLVKINVSGTGSNQVPQASSDAYHFVKNTPLVVSPASILDNDSDPDNGPQALTPKVETWPAHGVMIMGTSGQFRYVPDTNFEGTDFFTYRAFDGLNSSNLARVELSIATANNVAPVANVDNYQTTVNTTLNISAAAGVLVNDLDADNGPQAMTAVLSNNASNGQVTLSSDGSFVYVPSAGFVGNDVFSYRAFDGVLYSEIVNVNINVAAASGGGGGGGGRGGGGSVRNPRNPQIFINNNASVTNTISVNLSLSADNMIATYAPLEMRISNFSNFDNASWRPYATTTSWSLLTGNGTKTVYAQFKNKRGMSGVVSDTIQFSTGQVLGDRDCSSSVGMLFAKINTKDATVYYIGSDCKKYAFPDPKTYYTWYDNFDKVVRVTVDELDLYPDGGVINYRPGIKLVKTQDSNKVYAVEPNGVLRHITSAAMARSLYGDNWHTLVQDVIQGYFVSTYTKGSSLNDLLPTGTLAKEPDNDTIYYIQNGKKRAFSSLAAFNANYFRMKDVVIRTNLASYTSGTTINRFETELVPYKLAQ